MKNLFQFTKSYPLVSLVAAVIVLAVALVITGNGEAIKYLLGGVSLLIALKLGIGMIQTLREGRYGIDILAVTAIVSTVWVGEYWAAIVIVLMLTGGEALEDYAAKRAKQELNALLDRAPQVAHRVVKGVIETISLSKVRPGDILLVKPSEVVPVDAVLNDARAEFDESSLTGESLPVERQKGDALLSGSVNGDVAVYITASKTAKESQYQQIIALVKAASSTEAPFVRLADRYAVPFTAISFLIAGFAWWLSGDAVRFAQVLVVATPCPLLLGAPIALISGMSRAAKHGIIVKSGGVLERLATIKSVAFDKTGTLTHGQPQVADVVPAAGFTLHEVLQYAASAEQQSSHVLAAALVEYAASEGVKPLAPESVKETTSRGVEALIHGKSVLVGKREFLKKMRVRLLNTAEETGETVVYVAIDGVLAGMVTFRDAIRPETKRTLRSLATVGVQHTVMLTGDLQATAERIARELGITDVRAECLPADKVEAVRSLEYRPVMMVGDGVNDAPVLAAADIGLAMGARGSTAASDSADVVVLVDDLSKSYQAIRIAKDTLRIALQSIWIGIAISVGLMVLASTGVIPAVVGAGLQEVVDVVVILNALRAHNPHKRL